jgi:hypothetical protein
MSTTATYATAVAAIRAHAEAEQARLDAVAVQARLDHTAALRAAATQGVDPDSPAYPVCALVAQTLTVGRADGYPAVALPDDTRRVVLAALAAGVLSHQGSSGPWTGELHWYGDASGLAHNHPACQADVAAWLARDKYRLGQTWRTL